MGVIPGMENVNWFGIFGTTMYWLGQALLYSFVALFLFLVYYITSFDIKAKVFRLYGSGKDGAFSFSKPKMNRFKWVNNKTAWKPMLPLFNKKEIEPFDSEYIYPGNNIFAFELNGEFFPGRVNINRNEESIRAEINPIPYHIRNWHIAKLKENEKEFAEHSFWEDNKYFIMGVACVLICCITCGVTVYLSYKFSGDGLKAANTVANALKGLSGVAPG